MLRALLAYPLTHLANPTATRWHHRQPPPFEIGDPCRDPVAGQESALFVRSRYPMLNYSLISTTSILMNRPSNLQPVNHPDPIKKRQRQPHRNTVIVVHNFVPLGSIFEIFASDERFPIMRNHYGSDFPKFTRFGYVLGGQRCRFSGQLRLRFAMQ